MTSKNIIENMKKHCRLKAYRLDTAYAKHRIQRSKINLRLYGEIATSQRFSWLPGKTDGQTISIRNGGLKIDLKELSESPSAVFKQINEFFQNLNIPEMEGAEDVLIRIAGIANDTALWATDLRPFDKTLPPAERLTILESYDRRITEQLGYWMDIGDNIAGDIFIPENSRIRPYYLNNRFVRAEDPHYVFNTENGGAIIYSVERKVLQGVLVELPVSYYVFGTQEEFPFHILPQREGSRLYPLYNLEKLRRFPETPVVMTEILELAAEFNRSSEELIFTSFYGGVETAPHTDVRPLFGNRRRTYYLLIDRPGCHDASEKFRTALAMAENFRKYDRQLSFLEVLQLRWKEKPNAKITDPVEAGFSGFAEVPMSEFLKRCREQGISLPDSLLEEDLGLVSGTDAENVRDEIEFLTPIANQGSLCVLYARQKAGKSFLALHLALSMAYGIDPFPDRWTNADGKPHTVLYFSGEMRQGIFKKRKMRADLFLKPSAKVKDNILFKHVRGRSLANPDDRKYFDRCIEEAGHRSPAGEVAMIVFDNWQSLCDSPSVRGSFIAFYRWIEKWLDLGVHVELVNHTNKNGAILGSGGITASVDMSIQLYRASDDDTIRILVSPEDVRDGKRSLFAPFIASYDFDNTQDGWTVTEPEEKELAKILSWNQSGCKGSLASHIIGHSTNSDNHQEDETDDFDDGEE